MKGSFVRSSVTMAAVVCASGNAFAAEPIVQDFDGWKITIQPGESASMGDIPPSPAQSLPGVRIEPRDAIRLASFSQVADAPRPEGTPPPPPVPESAAKKDGLPIITPGESDQWCDPQTRVSPPEGTVDPRYLSQMYYEIYKSIPFIRAEYDANPSYIHDTAVEFLFGKMRPTVIQRQTSSVRNFPYYLPQYNYGSPYVPYAYGGAGYVYPPLQLVVPGTGLRIHRDHY